MSPVWIIIVFIQSLNIIRGYNLRQRSRAIEIEGSGLDELKINDMVAEISEEKQVLEFALSSRSRNSDVMIKDQADLIFNCIILVFLLLLVSNLPMLTDELLAAGGRMRHQVSNMLGSKEGRSLNVNTLNHMATIVGKAVEIYEFLNK
jgi:hypothetical protein